MITAEPWKVLFFGVGCLVVAVIIGVWLNTGNDPDAAPVSIDPVESVKTLWGALLHWRPSVMSPTPARYAHDLAPEPEPWRSQAIPLPNGQEPLTPVQNANANAVNLYLNADEITALHRMIEHNKTAAKPSKTNTIQAGFGLSRGGGEKYQRASMIYDALFGTPTPAVSDPQYRQPDGSTAPAARPVTRARA